MLRTLGIIYATSTGNTEWVIDCIEARIHEAHSTEIRTVRKRAEQCNSDDLLACDVLLLACGSWNTDNIEGQLHPDMHALITKRAQNIQFNEKPSVAIGLGDERYYFKGRAAEKLNTFLVEHGATLLLPTLTIMNDPHDQTDRLHAWTDTLSEHIQSLPPIIEQ